MRDYELLGERLELDLAQLLHQRSLPLTPRLLRLVLDRPETARDLAERPEQALGCRALTEEAVVEALLALAFGLPAWQLEEALLHFLAGDGSRARPEARGL